MPPLNSSSPVMGNFGGKGGKGGSGGKPSGGKGKGKDKGSSKSGGGQGGGGKGGGFRKGRPELKPDSNGLFRRASHGEEICFGFNGEGCPGDC